MYFSGRIASEPMFQEHKEAELLAKLEQWPQSNAAHRKLLTIE